MARGEGYTCSRGLVVPTAAVHLVRLDWLVQAVLAIRSKYRPGPLLFVFVKGCWAAGPGFATRRFRGDALVSGAESGETGGETVWLREYRHDRRSASILSAASLATSASAGSGSKSGLSNAGAASSRPLLAIPSVSAASALATSSTDTARHVSIGSIGSSIGSSIVSSSVTWTESTSWQAKRGRDTNGWRGEVEHKIKSGRRRRTCEACVPAAAAGRVAEGVGRRQRPAGTLVLQRRQAPHASGAAPLQPVRAHAVPGGATAAAARPGGTSEATARELPLCCPTGCWLTYYYVPSAYSYIESKPMYVL